MSRILDYVLTPDEAEKLRVVDGISVARLRELADAEREGKIEILVHPLGKRFYKLYLAKGRETVIVAHDMTYSWIEPLKKDWGVTCFATVAECEAKAERALSSAGEGVE